MLEWTGERFLPWVEDAQINYEHLHRYALATEFVKGKMVLDLACGEGYGSYMLAQHAEHVTGIEIDRKVVAHAKSTYLRNNLDFVEGSITDVPIVGERRFDVIICFEGIEHVEDHGKLLSEVKRLIKRDGLFIVSTPNKAIYTDKTGRNNPFHVKELYFDEFKTLLGNNFSNTCFLGQRCLTGSNIWGILSSEHPGYSEFIIEKGGNKFHFIEKEGKLAQYFIAMSSDADLESRTSSVQSWLVDVSDALIEYCQKLQYSVSMKDAWIDELSNNLQATIRDKDTQIQSLWVKIEEKSAELDIIRLSTTWRVARKLHRLIDNFLPMSTRRRLVVRLILKAIVRPRKVLRRLKARDFQPYLRLLRDNKVRKDRL